MKYAWSLSQLLNQLSSDIQEHWRPHYEGKGKRKRWSSSTIARVLTKSDSLKRRWESLKAEEKAVWGLIDHSYGITSLQRLGRMVVLLGKGEEKDGRVILEGGRSLEEVVNALYDAALLAPFLPRWYLMNYKTYGYLWIIAAEYHQYLATAGRKALQDWLGYPLPSDRVEAGSPYHFQRDMLFLWGSAWRSPLRVLRDGHLGTRDVRRIAKDMAGIEDAEGLKEQDLPYFKVVHDMLTTLKLVSETMESFTARLDSEGHVPAFWHKSLPERGKLIWRTTHDLDWLWLFPSPIHAFLENSLDLNEPQMIEVTRKLMDVLQKKISQRSRHFWTYGDIWLWFLGMKEWGELWWNSMSSLSISFLTGEGEALLARLLGDMLHWMGFADRLWQGERVVGFRLSDLGRTLWTKDRRDFKEEGQVIVQPSFQVLAMGQAPLHHLALLETLSERVKVEHLVVEYKLDRDVVIRGAQKGLDATYALETLRQISTTELPQNVLRSLEEWIGESERVVAYENSALIAVADAALLDELVKEMDFRNRVVRLNEQTALVPDSLWPKVRDFLLKYRIPAETIASPEEELEDSAEVTPEGVIRPRRDVIGVFLRGTISRFAEPRPDGTWVLTPESVRRAVGSLPVEEIVAILKRLNGGPIPKEVEKNLYLWGYPFGRVQVLRLTVIRFPNPEALEVARRVLQLRKLLKPFPFAPDSGLALVDEKRLPEVLERLAALGIEVEGEA